MKNNIKSPVQSYKIQLQDAIPLKQPWRILIDPADVCNFECNFCFQHYDKNFRGSIMSEEIFEKILESLRKFDEPINVAHFYCLGEPLLNKLLPNFIGRIKNEALAKKIAITTNGSLITHEISNKLVAAGLDRLSVSLNGLSDDDFIRVVNRKVSFSKLYEEIRYFYSIRKKCHVHVKINGDYFSDNDRKRFIELFSDYADSINIDNVVNTWPGLKITNQVKNMYNDVFDNTAWETRGGDINNFCCPRMFYELVIHPDGSVSPCCVDYKYKSQNLGNIKETSLKEIWNGSKLLEMQINELKFEKSSYSVCNDCKGKFTSATVNITPYREQALKKLVDTSRYSTLS